MRNEHEEILHLSESDIKACFSAKDAIEVVKEGMD